jgi:hypothetical protein
MDEKGFEGIKVWQKAYRLALDIHKRLAPVVPIPLLTSFLKQESPQHVV